MFKPRICLALMILLIAALTGGCSNPARTLRMYAGAELPKEDVALLQPVKPASIAFVDGKKLGGNDSAEVLPGEHKLMIKLSTRFYYGAGWGGDVATETCPLWHEQVMSTRFTRTSWAASFKPGWWIHSPARLCEANQTDDPQFIENRFAAVS